MPSRGAAAPPPCRSSSITPGHGRGSGKTGQERSWPLGPGLVLAFPSSSSWFLPCAGIILPQQPRGLGGVGSRECARVLRGCCSRVSQPAAPRGSRILAHSRGSPASGTLSDDFPPPFFLFSFGWVFLLLFYSGVGLGLFPLSGTGALSAFPSALLPGPGEQRLLGGGVALSHLLTLCFLAQKGTRITELLGHY